MKNYIGKAGQRYHLIDALRGFAILNMTVFHLLYDLFEIYGMNSGWYFHPLTVVWEKFICTSFILLSGISLNFSRHAYRRGIIVNLCGFLVTIVTVLAMPNEAIWFGVLNFIGCSMLICQPLREIFDRINPICGTLVSLLFFALTYGVPNRYIGFFSMKFFDLPDYLYSFKYMFFLGFPSADFVSADYFPIFPWLFLFTAGYFLWRLVKLIKIEKYFYLKVPVLDFIGRYSLWIYLVHQPILMGICMLIFGQ